jgi:TAT (twin-arginine translocation) pathway signal sequence
MSEFQRRDFLKGAAAIAAGVTAGLIGAGRNRPESKP